jgi:hypothetical protein
LELALVAPFEEFGGRPFEQAKDGFGASQRDPVEAEGCGEDDRGDNAVEDRPQDASASDGVEEQAGEQGEQHGGGKAGPPWHAKRAADGVGCNSGNDNECGQEQRENGE